MENATIRAGDKLLILCSASTGNNIFCTPAIRFMRKHLSGSQIDVVALNRLSAEVFEGNTDINQLFVIDKTRKFDELAKSYDKVLCLNINATKKLSGSKTPLLQVPPFVEDIARAEQILQFTAGLIKQTVTDADRQYVICSGIPAASSILSKYDIASDDVLINVHMGCGRTLLHGWKFFYKDRANDVRLWPVENYIKLGNALISKNPKIRIVITGTRNESFLAKSFEKNVPGTINLVGKTSVKELFDMMHQIDLFASQDCGVFHVASGTSVPMVGLFAPTSPLLAGPFPLRPRHLILEKETMADIQVAEVVDAVFEQLAKFPRQQALAN